MLAVGPLYKCGVGGVGDLQQTSTRHLGVVVLQAPVVGRGRRLEFLRLSDSALDSAGAQRRDMSVTRFCVVTRVAESSQSYLDTFYDSPSAVAVYLLYLTSPEN